MESDEVEDERLIVMAASGVIGGLREILSVIDSAPGGSFRSMRQMLLLAKWISEKLVLQPSTSTSEAYSISQPSK